MYTIDMHCDTIAELYDMTASPGTDTGSLRSCSANSVDLLKLKKGRYLLQNFAVFVDQKATSSPMDLALSMIRLYQQELNHNQDLAAPVYKFEDIQKNRDAGLISTMLTLEEGAVLQGSLDALHQFYNLGVRMIALTWNYPNEIGMPNLSQASANSPDFTSRCDAGLTPFGLETISEMEKLGIIIDVSHLSDGGFWDIFHHTQKPFAASHSNAASVTNVCRNLTDDMIRALAERGGVMGLNYCYDFLCSTPDAASSRVSRISDMLLHIRHITNVGGIETCALGSDFDGIGNDVEFGDASGMEQFYDALRKDGFSAEETDKLFYKNVLRLYRDVLS